MSAGENPPDDPEEPTDEPPADPDADDEDDEYTNPEFVPYLTTPEETELIVDDIQLPGVYHVSEEGGGFTGKYTAERIVEQPNVNAPDFTVDDDTDETDDTDDTDETDEEPTDGEEPDEEAPPNPTEDEPPAEDESGDLDLEPGEIVPAGADLDPPAQKLTVRAVCDDDTWEALDELRRQEDPFDVELGPFTIEDMGLVDLSRRIDGTKRGVSDVVLKLQEHRVVVVHPMPASDGATDPTDPGGLDLPPGGPTMDWVGYDPSFQPPPGAIDVTAQGVDNTGGSDVTGALNGLHGSDTVLYFPEGEYLISGALNLGGSGWQWVGNGATLVIPASVGGAGAWATMSGDNWQFRNFVLGIQGSFPNSAAPRINIRGSNWMIQNILSDGMQGHPTVYPGNTFLSGGPQSGTGVIDNVLIPDGFCPASESSSRNFLQGANNTAHLIVRRLLVTLVGQAPLYVEGSRSEVTIENSIFRNMNSGIRLGAPHVVRNCRFDQSGSVPGQHWSGGGRTARGIRIAGNGSVSGEASVIGCDFVMTGPDASGAVIGSNRVSGGIRVEDCRIEGGGIQAGPNTLTARNINVTQAGVSASGGTVSDSCVTGGVSGASASNVSSGSCTAPNLSGAFPDSSAGDVGDPDAEAAQTGEEVDGL